LFLGMVAIFLVGTFVGLGGYMFTSSDVSEAVAVVGKTKIPYMRFQVRVNQYLDTLRARKVDVTEATIKEVKQGMLRDMIVDELLAQQAERAGMRVTDLEVAMSIRNAAAFQREGQFDQNIYFQALRYAYRTSPEDYEAQQRKALLAAKLKQTIYFGAKVLPEELREEFSRANAGSDKDFAKKKDEFSAQLQQQRAIELINFYLRQLSTQVQIQQFLDEREKGA